MPLVITSIVNSVILFPKELLVKLLCTAADFCPVADHEQVSEVFEIHRYESMNFFLFFLNSN